MSNSDYDARRSLTDASFDSLRIFVASPSLFARKNAHGTRLGWPVAVSRQRTDAPSMEMKRWPKAIRRGSARAGDNKNNEGVIVRK